VIFEKYSFALMLSLAFHCLLDNRYDPEITAANSSFSATAGCNFRGKTRKTVKCIGQKIRKTAIIVDKNREPKTKLEKTRKPHKTPTPK